MGRGWVAATRCGRGEAFRRAGDVALHAAENATMEGANDRPVEVPGQAPVVEEGTLAKQCLSLVVGVDDELEPGQPRQSHLGAQA